MANASNVTLPQASESTVSSHLDSHDVSLIQRKLLLSVDERVAELVSAVEFAMELRSEMEKARRGAA